MRLEGHPLQLVEETASGRLAGRERAVGRLLTTSTQDRDIMRCADVRRMARSTWTGAGGERMLHATWRSRLRRVAAFGPGNQPADAFLDPDLCLPP